MLYYYYLSNINRAHITPDRTPKRHVPRWSARETIPSTHRRRTFFTIVYHIILYVISLRLAARRRRRNNYCLGNDRARDIISYCSIRRRYAIYDPAARLTGPRHKDGISARETISAFIVAASVRPYLASDGTHCISHVACVP